MIDPIPQLEALCDLSVEHGASDILMHEGTRARVRISGRLQTLEMEDLDAAFFDKLWIACGAAEGALDHDASFVSQNGVRFRVNLLHQLGRRAAVFRRIRTDVPLMEALGLPVRLLESWVRKKSGIILVCGPTGSGKSTTLAAMLEWLNAREARHIVTIEDPVEYVFSNQLSTFTQREVGIDTSSFSEGLRRSLRQNPDVIMLGEIRDAVSAITAIQAAETGHLVLATLHSATAVETIERISLIFPSAEREAARHTLAEQLVGVLCQRLLPAAGGSGVVLACEYFTNEGASTRMIREGRLGDLSEHLLRADPEQSRVMLQSLAQLVKEGAISEDVAQSVAESPQELLRTLRGISSNTTGRR